MIQPPPLPDVNPYAAPVARVEDQYVGAQLVLADRGTRLVSAFVDWLILVGVVIVIAILAAIIAPLTQKSDNSDAIMIVFGVIGSAAFLSIWITNLVLLHRYGQTIAKRMFGIKIVRVDGSRCSLSRNVFARWLPVNLLRAIPLIGWLFWLLDVLLIFGQEQRCMHDLIADTIVVKA